jgi:hypothetical protein
VTTPVPFKANAAVVTGDVLASGSITATASASVSGGGGGWE